MKDLELKPREPAAMLQGVIFVLYQAASHRTWLQVNCVMDKFI